MSSQAEDGRYVGTEVAVIGMAGRFPGADTLEEFWHNQRGGVESIDWFSDDELRAAGVPDALIANPAYVKGLSMLRDAQHFDAAFFGYSPREAETLEPGHRLFLECAWEAMEDAGVDPARPGGAVGVYAGAGDPEYTRTLAELRPDLAETVGGFQMMVGSGKDFLAVRAAYKMDLRGPAVSVQTGCSTSLVAVHMAVQALLNRECDVALAGGAAVIPFAGGYLYTPGGVDSPDGRCRSYDASAAGTRAGSGVGVVVLKRLEDALRDGDPVRAVILGSAINNDGALKVAFTAPSVEGQAAVIGEALAAAGVEPETIRYVEGHGSGTELGDPIEITALTEAYRASTDRCGYCAVGSVKANIGHLGAAAGVAGLIRTVLALEHREVPPGAAFEAPNPKIDFAGSPFYVARAAEPWETPDGQPRRAGVSSFGIGGTNAHVIVEEAPEPEPSESRRAWHLLTLSAKTPSALDAATARLAEHLRSHPHLPLADVAWTLQKGRREMPFRRALAVREGEDAAALLEARHPDRVSSGAAEDGHRSVAFMFPGVGDQYPGMARGLYESEPVFREEIDRCAEILRPHLGLDLRDVLFPGEAPSDAGPAQGGIDLRAMMSRGADADPDAERLARTELAQPATFVVEYALAKLWISFGVVPDAVIGHSLGEYAAAAVAGVFPLEDALELVARRAKMIGELPVGAMLAVPLSADGVAPYLADGAVVATLNAPEMVTVAGTEAAVEGVRQRLEAAGIVARRLAATHAFHSPLMDPTAEGVEEMVYHFHLSAPRIPMLSNVTGTWITAAEATDPRYWARHLREPVQFDRGVAELLREPGRVLVEVGPGQTLSTFVRQRPAREDGSAVPVIPTVRYPYDRTPDAAFLLGALGRLWLAGVTPDWAVFHAGERLRKVPLPTYPWEKQRYWVDLFPSGVAAVAGSAPRRGRRPDPADWLYLPSWRRAAAVRPSGDALAGRWIVFHDGSALSDSVATALRREGADVVVARTGDRFGSTGADAYALRPDHPGDYDHLLKAVRGDSDGPIHAVHLWSVSSDGARSYAHGFLSAAWLADALGRAGGGRLLAVTAEAQEVTGEEEIVPAAATVAAALASAALEHPNVRCRSLDVVSSTDDQRETADRAARIAAEALSDAAEPVVALRGRKRYVRGFDAVRPAGGAALREGGVYLLAGALDGRHDALARHLVSRWKAKLVLVDERLPDREGWDRYVASRPEDDAARRWIVTVRELEAAGAEVLAIRRHQRERVQAEEALREAERRFGAVHGVLVTHDMIELGEWEGVGDVRSAKFAIHMGYVAAELQALEAALETRAVDFVAVESSLTPLLGGIGRARIAAAHAFGDAFASRHNLRHSTPWTALAWDAGRDAGETGDAYGLSPEETGVAFEHALSLGGEARVAVSTGDLALRVEEAHAPKAAAPAGTVYARPELATPYFPPTTESEEIVAGMWQELLGIDRIGVHDDFFSLGGHSLLATQITSRVRDLFALELPLKSVFEAPTVAKFAALIEAAIMAEIEAMSAEEILSLA